MVTVPALASGSMASSATSSPAAVSSALKSLSHGVERRCIVSRAEAISSGAALRGALKLRGSRRASAASLFFICRTVLTNEKPTSAAKPIASASSSGAIQRGARRLRQKSSLIACKSEIPVVERVEAEILVLGGLEGSLGAHDEPRARFIETQQRVF